MMFMPYRRLLLLYLGLVFYGVSSALMVRAQLGLDAWNVLHQGLARHTGLSFGSVVIVTGAILMLVWIPLRQRPGIGTISNVVLVGFVADRALAMVPRIDAMEPRMVALGIAIVLNGIATGMYIGAGFGPGPRDGLMTGLSKSRGWSIRVARTSIEGCVLVLGWMLGGDVGLGTVLYAAAIGPLVQATLPLFGKK